MGLVEMTICAVVIGIAIGAMCLVITLTLYDLVVGHDIEENRMNLVWNVYHYNFNLGKIETFNIFDHHRFSLNIHKALKQCETKEYFAEIVKKELMYYFWSKSEYEIIIDGWISRNNSPQKIDIYEQVLMNFDVFVDYVWDTRKGESEC